MPLSHADANAKPMIVAHVWMMECLSVMIALTMAILSPHAHGANGAWNTDAAGNWSTTGNWNPTAVPGTTSGDVVNLSFDILAARTVTIDTTSPTLGDINIGDLGSPYFPYTLARLGNLVLNLDATGSGPATVDYRSPGSSAVSNVISTGITLLDHAVFRSNGTVQQAINGVITDGIASRSVTFNNDVDGVATSPGSLQGQFGLGATNTYDGGTFIDDVRVSSSTAGAFGTGAITVTGAGQVFFPSGSRANNLVLNSTGWAETAGNWGALRIENATVNGSVTLLHNTTIGVVNSNTGTLTGAISGAYDITKVGQGGLSLSGSSNTGWSGKLTVDRGTVRLSNANALSTGPQILLNANSNPTAAANQIGATLELAGGNAYGSGKTLTMVSGFFANNHRATLANQAGNNTWAGNIVLDSAQAGGAPVQIQNHIASTTVAISGTITATGANYPGILMFRGNLGSGVLVSTAVVNTPNTNFIKTDTGIWTIHSVGNNWRNTIIAAGTLALGTSDALDTGAVLTMGQGSASTGQFDLQGFNQTVTGLNSDPLSTSPGHLIYNTSASPGTLTTITAGSDTLNGTLSGNLSLVKNGTGLLTLNHANSGASPAWTAGSITVNEGAFNLNGTFALGDPTTSSVVADGATLGGEGAFGGDVRLGVTTGANLVANAATVGALTVGGTLTLNGITQVQITGPVASSPLRVVNVAAVPGGMGLASLSVSGFLNPSFVFSTGPIPGVDLTFDTSALKWTGAGGGTWDRGITASWENGPNTTAFYQGDNVTFDNLPGTNQTIAVVGSIKPSGIVFNHSAAVQYVLTGTMGSSIDSGLFTKDGTGTVVLALDSVSAQAINIANGTLQLGNGGTTGTISGPISNAAALVLNHGAGASTIVPCAISGPGTITKLGVGISILSGTNTYTGTTTVTAGTLQIGNGGTSGTLGEGAVINGASLVFNRSDNFMVSNWIAGVGQVIKVGIGTLTLNAPCDYSGGTVVQEGVLALSTPPAAHVGIMAVSGQGVLRLDFFGSAVVGGLVLNGIHQGSGLYGGIGSGAQFEVPFIIGSGMLLVGEPKAEIAVEQADGTPLINGISSIDLGKVAPATPSSLYILTIKNLGAANLTGLSASVSGANASDFTMQNLGVTTLAPGESTILTVTFTPGALGVRTAAIKISSNDGDENPFNISLLGTGAMPCITGTWNQDADGNWDLESNPAWASGLVAQGADATANFNYNLTADRTVVLNQNLLIGRLYFADPVTASPGSWILGGTGTLRLETTTDTPSIAVNALGSNKIAAINLALAGTQGFLKTGSGSLWLNGNNSGLSGTMTLLDVTGTNNAGVVLASSGALGGMTSITINGTATSGQYLGLSGGVTLGPDVTIYLNSPGGNSAPPGGIRSLGDPMVVNTIQGPIQVMLNGARIANNAAKRLELNGAMIGGSNGILFRHAANEGIHLTNTANLWTGNSVNSEGILWADPGCLPAASNLIIAASSNGLFQSSGSFTREIGSDAGEVQWATSPSPSRAGGFSARGGDLIVNLGGQGAVLPFCTALTPTGNTIIGSKTITNIDTIGLAVGQFITGIGIPAGATITAIGVNQITLSASAIAYGNGVVLTCLLADPARITMNTLWLNGPQADGKLTLVNPLDLNGSGRTIQVDATVAELAGGIRDSGMGYSVLTKAGPGTLLLASPSTWTGGLETPVSDLLGRGDFGVIRITHPEALGPIDANKIVHMRGGGRSICFIELADHVTIDANKTLQTASRHYFESYDPTRGSLVFLRNASGSNAWLGNILINGGGGSNSIECAAGTLTVGAAGTISTIQQNLDPANWVPRVVRIIGGGTTILNSQLADNGGSRIGPIMMGSGSLSLPRTDNTFSLNAILASGTTTITHLTDNGTACSLGTAGEVHLGGTLIHSGETDSSSNRVIALMGSSPTLKSSGTGELRFTGTSSIGYDVTTGTAIAPFPAKETSGTTLAPFSAGATTVEAFDVYHLIPGMTIIGRGLADGTKITAINYDTRQLTLDTPTILTTLGGMQLSPTAQANSGQPTIQVPPATASLSNLFVGMTVTGTGIPTGAIITEINPETGIIALSTNLTTDITTTATLSFLSGLVNFTGADDINRTFTLGGANSGANTFAPVLVDPAGTGKLRVVKTDPGAWTLTGANTYSGGTVIEGGVLTLATVPQAHDGIMSIGGQGRLRLDFVATVLVGGLVLGESPQGNGLYGAVGSGAPLETPFIEGTGRLQIGGGDGSPLITSTLPQATGKVGEPYNHTCTATGTPLPLFSAVGLPPGLTISETGRIAGTPTAGGVFNGTITAANGTQPNAMQDFSITILHAPMFTSGAPPVAGKLGTAYSHHFTAAGTVPLTFSLTSGELPAGLSLSAAGVISGTPTATGTFSGTITASNNVPPDAAQDYSITISESPVITSGAPAASGKVGTPYSHASAARGTPAPKFTATGLPAGLTINSAGIIAGTPTAWGTFSGTIIASNGVPPNATQAFTITMGQSPAFTSAPPFATGKVGAPYSHSCIANGTTPISFSVTSGALPTGLTMDDFGVISGTPTAEGAFIGTITASNGVPPEATQVFSITITQTPVLTLVLGDTVIEGGSLTGQLSVTPARAAPMLVTLASSRPNQLSAGPPVTIPAGETSVPVTISGVQDSAIEAAADVRISASAPGANGTEAVVTLLDDDWPILTLGLDLSVVAETAGPNAIVVTVTRDIASSQALPVWLTNSEPAALAMPETVTIPAGSRTVSFQIGVIDNSTADGPRTAILGAEVRLPGAGVISDSSKVNLEIGDDEGARLEFVFESGWVQEGASAAATVRRLGGTNTEPLTVHLAAAPGDELSVNSTVDIPAGAAEAQFTLSGVTDAEQDGNVPVRLAGTATGYSPGQIQVIVTDRSLPDLVAKNLSCPVTVATEASFQVSYHIDNRGGVATTQSFTQRLLLSKDPVVGDDVLLGQYVFSGTMNADSGFDRMESVRAPRAAGTYWLLLVTDATQTVEEILETNNTALFAEPITVSAAYGATVRTDAGLVPANTPIVFTGSAAVPSGPKVPNVMVNIHIRVAGTERIIAAMTNSIGDFSTTWQPLPGEGGDYEIGAAHPGVPAAPTQATFAILTVKSDFPQGVIAFDEGASATFTGDLTNPTAYELTGLALVAVNAPAGLGVQVTLPGTTLDARQSLQAGVTLTGAAGFHGNQTVTLRLTTDQGVTLDVAVPVTVRQLMPQLVILPASLKASVLRGEQKTFSFSITNSGGAASGPVNLLLPNLPWLQLASPATLESIPPGGAAAVTLLLSPGSSEPLTLFTGNLVADPAVGNSISLPFEFRIVSARTGALQIEVVDEAYYYTAAAPKVSGATVTLRDAISAAQIATIETPADGRVAFNTINEGWYSLEVDSPNHTRWQGNIYLNAGEPNFHQVFISREWVSYNWTVEEVALEDHYRIAVETKFETNVPAPVVTVTPGVLDVEDLVVLGQTKVINFTIENHGLIAANGANFTFDQHPFYEVTPLIEDIGTIPAKSSITIPVTVRRIGVFAEDGSIQTLNGTRLRVPKDDPPTIPCWFFGRIRIYFVCGVIPIPKVLPLAVSGVRGNCSGKTGTPQPPVNPPPPHGPVTPPSYEPINYTMRETSCLEWCLAKATLDCQIGFIPVVDCIWTTANCVVYRDRWECASLLTCIPGVRPWVGQTVNAALCVRNYVKCHADWKDSDDNGRAVLGEAWPGLFPPEMREFDPALAVVIPRLEALLDFEAVVLGKRERVMAAKDPAVADWYASLASATSADSAQGTYISAEEIASLRNLAQTHSLDFGTLEPVILRLNRTADYLQRGIKEIGDVPAGESLDFIQESELRLAGAAVIIAQQDSIDNGYANIADELQRRSADLKARLTSDSGGVCATVKIKLDQQAVMTRSAFRGTLELTNNKAEGSLTQVGFDLDIRDTAGNDARDLFNIQVTKLTGLAAIDGTGQIGPKSTGSAQWTLIPLDTAAPLTDTAYTIGGTIRYDMAGTLFSIPVTQVPISVKPDAALYLKYFHQRDVYADDPHTDPVEPSIPYALAVMAENRGAGAAHNLRVTSAQPEIVDNEKGLLIDFHVMGTEVAGQNLTPSLTANFGEVPPGQRKVGTWWMTSSLQGLFTSYDATFEHLDGFGDARLSLIKDIEIHEMTRMIEAQGPLADGEPDFLVNDMPDINDFPDRVHLSDGTTAPVDVYQIATLSGNPRPGSPSVTLTASLDTGWAYLRIPDPANGTMRLTGVQRSDGLQIPLDKNVWTTDRTFIGLGKPPIRENILHLADFNSTGTYTLTYATLPGTDITPPSSRVAALLPQSGVEIPVTWSGSDDQGIASYDVFVQVDGGIWQQWLMASTRTASIYPGEAGHSYAFYSRATDRAGNTEVKASADTSTQVSLINAPPVITPIPVQVIPEGSALVYQVLATDPDAPSGALSYAVSSSVPGIVINSSGRLNWVTSEADGGSEVDVIVTVTDSGSPPASSQVGVQLSVLEMNSPPLVPAVGPQYVEVGKTLTLSLSATDRDFPEQTLTYAFTGNVPEGMTLHPVTGLITWTPAKSDSARSHPVTVTVTDSGVPAAFGQVSFAVSVPGLPATIVTHPASVIIDSGDSVTLNVSATGTDPLTYQWYQGTSGNTAVPVGSNSPSFTTPALTATTSYWVKVTNAANPAGANSNTATVALKTVVGVTLGSLAQVYDGSIKAAVATTDVPGLAVNLRYNGNASAPVDAGSYEVVATIVDPAYAGKATGTLVIAKAPVMVTLGGLTATFDGEPKPATATTTPEGLTVSFAYGGVATSPTNAGSYPVVGTIDDANYEGCANGTLVIAKAPATLTIANLAHTYDGTAKAANASTTPLGLTVGLTYDGSPIAPRSAGAYEVAATIEDTNYEGTISGTLVIGKAIATVTFKELHATYDGTAKSASVDTDPAGMAVILSYDGSLIAPISAGRYTAVATINDPNYEGSLAGTLVISKATASVTLENISATYDGTAKAVSATTNPAGLATSFTYDGSSTAPTNAGSYPVTVTIDDANYDGSASGIFRIGKASVTVTLGGLLAIYDGTAKAATVTTSPEGLAVSLTYDGSLVTPTIAGSYPVVAAITDSNFEGTANGTLRIGKAAATVTLAALSFTYNGSPKPVTATTTPEGLSVIFSYAGAATAPTNAGSYPVVGIIDDANYEGSESGSLVIDKANQFVTFASIADQTIDTPVLDLVASSSSTHVVLFSVVSGPASVSGSKITLSGLGEVVVQADQPGDVNWLAAVPVQIAFRVVAGNFAQDYVWAKGFGGTGFDTAYAVATDPTRQAYLLGDFAGTVTFGASNFAAAGGAASDMMLTKMNTDGGIVWTRQYGGVYADYAKTVVTLPSGGVVAGGEFYTSSTISGNTLTSAGSKDIMLVKVDANGTTQWAKRFGGTASDSLHAMVVDASGNLYLAGQFNGSINLGNATLTSSGASDGFIAKLDSTGTVIWARKMGGPSADIAYSVAVKSTGELAVAGSFSGVANFGSIALTSDGDSDAFVTLLDSVGAFQWAKRFGGSTSDHARATAFDAAGNLWACGSFTGSSATGLGVAPQASAGAEDIFVVRLTTADGTLLETTRYGGPGTDMALSLVADPFGTMMLAGSFKNTITLGSSTLVSSGLSDTFLAKLRDGTGVVWALRGGGANDDRSQALAIGTSGDIIHAGVFDTSATFGVHSVNGGGLGDLFIAKINGPMPSFTAGFADHAVDEGDPWSLSTGTTGAVPVSFQWFKDGTLIEGATSNRYEVAAAALSDEGIYVLQATNAYGTATTMPVTVTIAVRVPDQVLSVELPLTTSENRTIEAPIYLDSLGDVGSLSFVIPFNKNYLTKPSFVPAPELTDDQISAVVDEDSGTVHIVVNAFLWTLREGRQLLGTLHFVTRSVPVDTSVKLTPSLLHISDVFDRPLGGYTRLSSGTMAIAQRFVPGDTNNNGRLDISDAAELIRLCANPSQIRTWDQSLNDLTGDAILTDDDVTRALRAITEIETPPVFPISAPPGPHARLVLRRLTGIDANKVLAEVYLDGVTDGQVGLSFRVNYPVSILRITGTSSLTIPPGGLPSATIPQWNVAPGNKYAGQTGSVGFAAAWDASHPFTSGQAVANIVFELHAAAISQVHFPLELAVVEVAPYHAAGPSSPLAIFGQVVTFHRTYGDWALATLGHADANSNADADSDGESNGLEFAAATNPVDAQSRLKTTAMGRTQAGFSLRWLAAYGVRYRVRWSRDLANWTDLTTVPILGSGEEIKITDPTAPNGNRYYRVEVMPDP